MSSKKLVKIDPPKGLKSDFIKLGYDQNNPRRSVKTVNPQATAILGKKKPQHADSKPVKRKGKWLFGVGAFLGPLAGLAGKSWGMDFPEPPELSMTEDPIVPIPSNDTSWMTLSSWLVDHASLLSTTAIVGFSVVATLAILHRLIRIEKAICQNVSKHEAEANSRDYAELGIRSETGGASRTGLVRRENQDAYCTFDIPGQNISIVAVFDGMGGRPNGKEAAEFAASFIKDWLVAADADAWQFADQTLVGALKACQQAFKNSKQNGATTALLVAVATNGIHYAALGGGCIALIHSDGMAQQLLAPHHKPGAPKNLITAFLCAEKKFKSRSGTIACEPNSIVLAMSDGASDLVSFDRLGAQFGPLLREIKACSADSFAEKFLADIEKLTAPDSDRPLHTDNMTLALCVVGGQP